MSGTKFLPMFAALALLTSSLASAATFKFIGTVGDDEYTDATNWDVGTVPGTNDVAYVYLNRTSDFNSAGIVDLGTLRLGQAFGAHSGELDIQSGTLRVGASPAYSTPYTDSAGVLIVSGGRIEFHNGDIELGRREGVSESVTVSGGTFSAQSGSLSGGSGSYTFTVTGGLVEFVTGSANFRVEPDSSDPDPDSVVFSMSGGALTSPLLCLGCNVTNPIVSMVQTGGFIDVDAMRLGTDGLTGPVSALIDAGDLVVAGDLQVFGTSVFEVAGSEPSVSIGGDLHMQNWLVSSTVKMTLDAAGVSPIELGGDLKLVSNGILDVDASAYNPDNGATVTLIDYTSGNRTGSFVSSSVTPPPCYTAAIDAGSGSGDVVSVSFTWDGDCAAIELLAADLLCSNLASAHASSFQALAVLADSAIDAAFVAAGCAPNAACKATILANLIP